MNGKFKTCARGHYYSAELDQCPYCPSANGCMNSAGLGANDARTMDMSGMSGNQISSANEVQYGETKDMPGVMGNGGASGETKTSFVGDFGGEAKTVPGGPAVAKQPIQSERTMMFEDDGYDEQGNQQVVLRNRRKLVGWLVSYTLDDMGMDFKLYEGRNIVGRDIDCQISIADKTVSGKHAVILFRSGKFSVTDQQSSQGTFVNDEDIELDPRYLKDGDMIRIGQTLLKFRSAL